MSSHLVVVGASLAGLRAVEAARRTDPSLRITLVGAEPHLPYDRPPLSKELLGPEPTRSDTTLRQQADFSGDLDVELRLGAPATALDTARRSVTVGGEGVGYDRVVIATGSRPRELAGATGLAGVHTLRTVEDSRAIRAALDAGARTVVIGGGFIGAEVASAARARGLDVTIVEGQDLPLIRAVGVDAGRALGALHARYGATLLTGASVAAVEGDGRVEGVRLADGTALSADLVVVGVGAEPVVDWLGNSGLTLDDGVVCDETLRAGEAEWAAGDVARWPHQLFGTTLRVEHWTNAAEQGTRAGRNAADPATAEAYAAVPYFWSDWYGARIQFAGRPSADEFRVVWGDLDSDRWLALYRRDDRVVGVLALNGQRVVPRLRRLIAAGAEWQTALDTAAALPEPQPVPEQES